MAEGEVRGAYWKPGRRKPPAIQIVPDSCDREGSKPFESDNESLVCSDTSLGRRRGGMAGETSCSRSDAYALRSSLPHMSEAHHRK